MKFKTKKQKLHELRDCSKCNEVININDELHCKMNMQEIDKPTAYSKVTMRHCVWFRTKKIGILNEA
ncbi:hypothetical protein AAX29_00582 [Aliarcobacter thereius]|uniref:Uncharacterized protein n=1 Tax=Aliarcobacter thereius TaxID=544718 RepID=A0A1C0B7K3_9BACT|nr:hypothetical protein [Aliarcobacter thereius]OCL99541.1 hypothetical protein AAX29_00582 [Aliarcobacter thereius]